MTSLTFDDAKETLDVILSDKNYKHLFNDVEGYLYVEEGCALLALAAKGPGHGNVVEIGSYRGRSTCFLAYGVKISNRGVVYAIDHFEGSPEHKEGALNEDELLLEEKSLLSQFEKNIKKHNLHDHVNVIVSESIIASTFWDGKPIRLLFIDGDHSYNSTKSDFEAWSKYIETGGVLAFHDVGDSWPGVTRFTEELISNNSNYKLKLAVGSLRVFQKK